MTVRISLGVLTRQCSAIKGVGGLLSRSSCSVCAFCLLATGYWLLVGVRYFCLVSVVVPRVSADKKVSTYYH